MGLIYILYLIPLTGDNSNLVNSSLGLAEQPLWMDYKNVNWAPGESNSSTRTLRQLVHINCANP